MYICNCPRYTSLYCGAIEYDQPTLLSLILCRRLWLVLFLDVRLPFFRRPSWFYRDVSTSPKICPAKPPWTWWPRNRQSIGSRFSWTETSPTIQWPIRSMTPVTERLTFLTCARKYLREIERSLFRALSIWKCF